MHAISSAFTVRRLADAARRAGAVAGGWLGLAVSVAGAGWEEDFSGDPALRGWQWWGEASLFQWNASNAVLEVTWDSSKPNSYFYRPLGIVLTRNDDFRLGFELELEEITIGVDPEKPYTFELAIGFIRFEDATHTNFFRGAGINATYGPRNLVELDYFPDSGFGATVAPTVATSNNRIAFSSNHPLELEPGRRYAFEMTYRASDQTLRTAARRDGEPFGLPPGPMLADLDLSAFPDFQVDALAVCSYSDEHQSPPQFQGSILARGTVHRLDAALLDPPVTRLSGRMEQGHWRVEFDARAGWSYRLERSALMGPWDEVDQRSPALDGPVSMVHTNAAALGAGFYRVRAERP